MSREELAKRTGYQPASVRNWETGIRSAEDKLELIAQALGLTVDGLRNQGEE